jgi:hypothetical protein
LKTTTKGNQFEIEVKKHWESEGWTVFRQHRKPMFINGRMITVGADVFGCDMICKKKGERTAWLQVSTIENKSAKEKQVIIYPWDTQAEDVELWLRVKGRKAYRRFCLQPDLTFTEAPEVVLVPTKR